MSSRNTSNKNGLVAFPSVSQSLHSLSHATSMSNVALHHNMYAMRAKESEAKLQHAFTKPTLSPNSPLPCQPTQHALMMRAPVSPPCYPDSARITTRHLLTIATPHPQQKSK
ncbi:hypothetical protein B0H12DRAFT_1114661 [Mycena haematopus]|nr:hypothetical protein B0H12DRAFT_1114661 [Mycena haematopus]